MHMACFPTVRTLEGGMSDLFTPAQVIPFSRRDRHTIASVPGGQPRSWGTTGHNGHNGGNITYIIFLHAK